MRRCGTAAGVHAVPRRSPEPARTRNRAETLRSRGSLRAGHAIRSRSSGTTRPAGRNRRQEMARQRKTKGTLTRRAVLKRGAALTGAAAASGAITGFPMVWAQNIKDVTLRQFGTGVSNINAIAEKAKEDPRHHAPDDRARHRLHRAARGHPAEELRHRRHRVLHAEEGVGRGQHAADGHLQAPVLRQDRRNLQGRQADPDLEDRARHRPAHGELRGEAGRQAVRGGDDELVHDGADHLQRRHPGDSARPHQPAPSRAGPSCSTPSSRARRRS